MKASSSGTPTSRTSAAAARASTSRRPASHFELFGLAPAYALDAAALEQSYRDLQALVHPDRHASAAASDRLASLALATDVNEAYRALKDPVQRAKYLLELQGVDVGFETNTQMPSDFLLQQLQTREEIEEAIARKHFGFLDALKKKLAGQRAALEARIGEHIDARRDYAGAVDPVRKLMFLQKIDAEIDAAYEAIE